MNHNLTSYDLLIFIIKNQSIYFFKAFYINIFSTTSKIKQHDKHRHILIKNTLSKRRHFLLVHVARRE